MSGHSHWAGIKHQKGITDQKRARVFSKLLNAVTAAVGTEPNPDFNPRLRTAVLKAKAEKVPSDNILRAITRASDTKEALEELMFEAYGPGGAAIFIEAITGNRNRTIPEVKKILSDHEGKWAETGSVAWAFEQGEAMRDWKPKFIQELSREDKEGLAALIAALHEHDDVQHIVTNAAL